MQNSLVRKTIALAAIVYTIIITVGALVSPVKVAGAPSFFDKIIHVTAHFGLVALWVLWCIVSNKAKRITAFNVPVSLILLRIFLLAVLYGITIEVLQGTMTSYRTPDIYDVGANTAGALLAVLVGYIFKSKLEGLKSRF